MRIKLWALIVGLLALVAVSASTAGSAPTKYATTASSRAAGDTLVIAQQSDPGVVNELLGDTPGALFVHHNVYQELVNLAYDGHTIVPELAKSWTVSKNGLNYVFHLRQGVKWQDGKPFTSADVKYTMDVNNSLPSWAVAYLAPVRKVTTQGPYTVTFTLKQPSAGWLTLFAFGSNWGLNILPKHLYQGTNVKTSKYNQAPIGTGPYRFVNHVAGQYITLAANPNYWGPKPAYKRVVIKIIPSSATALQELQAGTVDYVTTSDNPVAFSQIPPLLKNPQIGMSNPLGSVVIWLLFNTKDKVVGDPRFRQAIAYAMDRTQYAQTAYFNFATPMSGFYLKGKWYNSRAELPYNPAKATALLNQLGYKPGSLTLEVAFHPLFGMDAVAQLLKAQLSKVGINVDLWSGDYPTWFDKVHKKGDYQVAIRASQIGPDPDLLWQWLDPTHEGESGSTFFNNPQMTSLFTRGRQATSETARKAMYGQVQTILQQNVPVLPLVNIEDVNLWRRDRVKGVPSQVGHVANRWSLGWVKPR